MELTYDIFTQDGQLYETVFFSGEDEEDCEEQLDWYLTYRRQNCYAQQTEEES